MSTASTSLSTRVDAGLKAELIRRAGELGVPPSQLLKDALVEYLGSKKETPGGSVARDESLTRLTRAAKGIGTYRMRRCKHNERGICHNWAWEERPEDALVGVVRCEDGSCWASNSASSSRLNLSLISGQNCRCARDVRRVVEIANVTHE